MNTLSDILTQCQRFFERNETELYDNYKNPYSLLYLPLLTQHSLTITQAIDESRNLLKRKFGPHAVPQFEYSNTILLLQLFLFFSLATFFSLFLHWHLFTILSVCVFAASLVAAIVDSTMLLFAGAVYSYCINGPVTPFEQKDMSHAFAHEEPFLK